MSAKGYLHPVLSCEEARRFEARILPDEAAEWSAMKLAGLSLARKVIEDYCELQPPSDHLRVLALIGKGNNGGDALVACGQILADFPRAKVDVILTCSEKAMRPLAARAMKQLEGRVQLRVLEPEAGSSSAADLLRDLGGEAGYHLALDGLVGMSLGGPLRKPLAGLVCAVNAYPLIDLRASVDLPSGLGEGAEHTCFRADFTYATGILKAPLLEGSEAVGRVRYLDLGFFDPSFPELEVAETDSVMTPSVLEPLRQLRPAHSDKTSFGHLFIVGGSVQMPGALMMAVEAAIRSGVGLVTAFAPASLVGALATRVPEAMWVPWPEMADGSLNPKAFSLLMDRLQRADCILVGPGMGRARSVELLTQLIVSEVECPVLLDADALQVRVMEAAQKRKPAFGPVVATPHLGEFIRMTKSLDSKISRERLLGASNAYRTLFVLKGAITRISGGNEIIYSVSGGPVLSRGGSGDLLAGIIGGQMAQEPQDIQKAVLRAVAWHGLAADRLARAQGQVAVRTTSLLDYLGGALRG